MCSSSVATVSMLIRGSWYNRFDIVFSPSIDYSGIFFVPPAAAKREKGFFGDTPNPGKGLRPLHSYLIRCLRRLKGTRGFWGALLHPPYALPPPPANGSHFSTHHLCFSFCAAYMRNAFFRS